MLACPPAHGSGAKAWWCRLACACVRVCGRRCAFVHGRGPCTHFSPLFGFATQFLLCIASVACAGALQTYCKTGWESEISGWTDEWAGG
eukprot:190899-Chlamydomonas_euryale.AAC.8